jgi:hypothetical protein
MSTTTVILLVVGIAVYLAFVVFVLGLCKLAHRADVAEQRPRVFVDGTERFLHRDGDELIACDVEHLDQRAAREVRGP